MVPEPTKRLCTIGQPAVRYNRPRVQTQKLMIASPVEKLKNAFITALGVSPDGDFESMAYGQTTGWDSVAHMSLISEIETEFDIMLATDDVIGMSSFRKAKEIIARNGVSFD
jgi:acyl carrier protein